ncbi:MAG: hypothetical protein JTJ18_11665, partial [Streptococcus sp.]|nr:hypothetical protein [Streptococcus sp.]
SASRISLLNWFIGKASVLIVFSDLIIRGRLSLFQFNLEIYTKYFTLPLFSMGSNRSADLWQIKVSTP